MLFNSYEFLFAFLPITLAVYYALRNNTARLAWLTIASYLFYGWVLPKYCVLLVGISIFDWIIGLQIEKASAGTGKKVLLAASIVANLGLLAVFKYATFTLENINEASHLIGLPSLVPVLQVVLPVGISFHTFQSISYNIDVYRGHTRAESSLLRFMCFIAFFPQLVAGPVVRYVQVAEEFESRTHSFEKAARGIHFFVRGFAKKVLIADTVAPLTVGLDAMPLGFVPTAVAAAAYTVQIYYDFSGYSDMAIGLACLFGFDLPPNFDAPYQSNSITEFWRRWHISLSSWLRDYLYIPLGGSRHGPWRTYFALLMTMLLGGLWHGANWTFIAWGAWHGSLLAIERAAGDKHPTAALPPALARALTLALVVVGWIFFRAPTLPIASSHLLALCGLYGWGGVIPGMDAIGGIGVIGILVGFSISQLGTTVWKTPNVLDIRVAAADLAIFLAAMFATLGNRPSPFLYFQF